MPTKDETVALLTEIRDILKEDREDSLYTKKSRQRSLILKIAYNGAIIVFVILATYFYYHSLVQSLGG